MVDKKRVLAKIDELIVLAKTFWNNNLWQTHNKIETWQIS